VWTDAMTRSRRTGDRGIERSFVNGCCAREIAHEDARRGMAGDANVSRASRVAGGRTDGRARRGGAAIVWA